MHSRINNLIAAVFCLTVTQSIFAAEPIHFTPAPHGLQLPDDLQLGQCSAVDFDSKGRLYLFHRGKRPILCFDADGKFVRSWGDDLIGKAHGLRVDAEDNVWVTDIGHHMVFKFDAAGKLLLALGQTGKKGTGENQFDQPTDVAFGKQGEVYVSDGYGNSRVMKFDAKGKFLGSWGTPGTGPGEFDLPHAIIVDKTGRVLVGDRENDRVQVFDAEGKLLEIWPGFAPYGMELDKEGRLFVADGRASKVLLVTVFEDKGAGKVQQSWGEMGKEPGQFNLPHMLAVDKAGNLYVAEVGGKRLQKLERK